MDQSSSLAEEWPWEVSVQDTSFDLKGKCVVSFVFFCLLFPR